MVEPVSRRRIAGATLFVALLLSAAAPGLCLSPAFITVRDQGRAYDKDRPPLVRLYPGQQDATSIPEAGAVINMVGQRVVQGTVVQTTRRFAVRPLPGGYHFEQITRPPELSVLPRGMHGFRITDRLHGVELLLDIAPGEHRLSLELLTR